MNRFWGGFSAEFEGWCAAWGCWHGDACPGQDLGIVCRRISNVVTTGGGVHSHEWASNRDGMTLDQSVHILSSCWSPLRLPKGKWNSPNGVEEKETWVEEDELFQVQGKLGDSPWSLLGACWSVDACYFQNNVPETACLHTRKGLLSSSLWFIRNKFYAFSH